MNDKAEVSHMYRITQRQKELVFGESYLVPGTLLCLLTVVSLSRIVLPRM